MFCPHQSELILGSSLLNSAQDVLGLVVEKYFSVWMVSGVFFLIIRIYVCLFICFLPHNFLQTDSRIRKKVKALQTLDATRFLIDYIDKENDG